MAVILPVCAKICPKGWHVPSQTDWNTLLDFLGGDTESVSKMKVTGRAYWEGSNADASNRSGFSALPGGECTYGGDFWNKGRCGKWWTSSEENKIAAWSRLLDVKVGRVTAVSDDKTLGMSVRCIKD